MFLAHLLELMNILHTRIGLDLIDKKTEIHRIFKNYLSTVQVFHISLELAARLVQLD